MIQDFKIIEHHDNFEILESNITHELIIASKRINIESAGADKHLL